MPPLGGGRLDPHALVETLAVYLVVPTVCLFEAGLTPGEQAMVLGICCTAMHELDYFARGRNKVGGAN